MAEVYEIFESQYLAEAIENAITNGVPYINSTNKHWMRWNISTSEWVDTGIIAEADMTRAVYDSNNEVATAGGIVPYVDANGGKIDHIQINGTEQTVTDKTVNLVVDATPTSGSNNPVQSGGVKSALDLKQDTLTFDNTPTAGSTNPVSSGGVKSYVDTQDGKRTRNNITNNLANLTTAIAEQNLEKYGYAIGDYFVGASGYKYHLADMDTCYGGYNSYAVVGTHHCGVVVDTLSTCQWLSSGSATSYGASTLHSYLTNTALPNIKSDITALFGDWSNHLLTRTELDNAIGGWGGSTWMNNLLICALSEVQMYGARVFGADGFQTGTCAKPLELFAKYRWNEIFGNISVWLKSLYSASAACYADSSGHATNAPLSHSARASGLILLH